MHELTAPNLPGWSTHQRQCLACAKARSYARFRGIPVTSDLADGFYAQIMQEAS